MICVVGGSGFIGSRLCQRLARKSVDFSIVDKEPSALFPGLSKIADIRNPQALFTTIDEESIIINLAAEHRDNVRPLRLYDEVNVEGAKNLCEVARAKNVKTIVFTSSVAVYGFAPANTDESGDINYFNDYGRTKWLAENVYRAWHAEDVENRTLVIVRPTVVFGEQNRGNVYNLLRQIASGRFVMIGDGRNPKSMAYVENVAAFLEHSLSLRPGVHTYNYIDKPDFNMNELVGAVRAKLGKEPRVGIRLPYSAGLCLGVACDYVSKLAGKSLPISSIRVKKFCATTQFDTSLGDTGFVPPVSLEEGLQRTVQYEFLENHGAEKVFYTE